MKTISVEVQDEIYAYLEDYSKQTNKNIEDVVAEVISSNLSVLDFNRSVLQIKKRQEQWRRERGFPTYGKVEAVSHPLR